MTEHDLKTWPEFFQAIVENRKPFEYRLNDRDYQVGDVLHLREWVPPVDDAEGCAGYYTRRELRKTVTYVLPVGELGPAAGTRVASSAGFVIMGLGKMQVSGDILPMPWVPMSSPRDIAVVGKNIEELCEAAVSLARSLIQGIDSEEPSTGKPNRLWVQEELADVSATNRLTVDHFALDPDAMGTRAANKVRHLRRWFDMVSA
jgi:hypothetical protein